MSKAKVSITLDQDLLLKVEALAEKESKKLSPMINTLLTEYLETYQEMIDDRLTTTVYCIKCGDPKPTNRYLFCYNCLPKRRADK